MPFPGAAAEHQGAQLQEPWPQAAPGRSERLDSRAGACHQILVEQEKRLDCRCVTRSVPDYEIPVIEVLLNGILQELVIPSVLPLPGKSCTPMRQARQVRAPDDLH